MRHPGRMAISAVTLAVSALLLLPPTAFAAEQWLTTLVTNGKTDVYALAMSGGRLAWVETTAVAEPYRTGGRILTWKAGDTRPTPLGDGPETFGDLPRVSGDRVVWAGSWAFLFEPVRHIEAAVYEWTPADGRSVVATGAVEDACVDGDRIVWRTDVDPTMLGPHWFRVSGSRLGGSLLSLDPSHAGPPDASEGRFAWWDGSPASGGIYTWVEGDPAPVQVAVVDPPAAGSWANYQLPVHVSGDRIAWTASTVTGQEVFTWTPAGGVVQVTHDRLPKSSAEVSGDRIAWATTSGTRRDVYTWTPLTGPRRLRGGPTASGGPKVSGDRIVWAAGPAGGRQVYTWIPAMRAAGRVSAGRDDNIDPVVSGNRIAWRSRVPGGSYQIVTATPRRPRTRSR